MRPCLELVSSSFVCTEADANLTLVIPDNQGDAGERNTFARDHKRTLTNSTSQIDMLSELAQRFADDRNYRLLSEWPQLARFSMIELISSDSCRLVHEPLPSRLLGSWRAQREAAGEIRRQVRGFWLALTFFL